MKKRMTFVLFAALFILTAALLIGLFLSDSSREEQSPITLPAKGGAVIDATPSIGKNNRGKVAEITVDRTNAQRVVASLERPEQYSYTARAVYAYGTGSKELETQGWVRPDLCLTRQYAAGGALRAQAVLTAKNVYLWGADEGTYYQGKPGDFTADQMGRLPTYEDLADLPAAQILDGDTTERDGTPCVHVRSGQAKNYTDWYISLDNGLLLYAATTEGGAAVWSVELTVLTVGPVADSVFLLPNGTMPE